MERKVADDNIEKALNYEKPTFTGLVRHTATEAELECGTRPGIPFDMILPEFEGEDPRDGVLNVQCLVGV